ncbi:family 43 glycosylhydrolase [Acidipropionibacterium virtanenii]|uniref:Arabinoxylan arabinofuranohydrolase n=1 Tax=Acidipropionibacterium virtanenii TaxID=2057246 RepID=A0A344UWX9_9ACTN|nr:family 43 glycosylhydrolase [Acidipropionibacterium virtanenii]AXE39777.1 Arabinoxylan arabinofuranohydrolase [Acidipropionibacterium virtanenii]
MGEGQLGPFTDLGRPLIPAGQFAGPTIDPSVFTDDDGTIYLYWGNSVVHAVALNPDMVSFDADAVRSWIPTDFREAVFVHRRGDVYYASWSVNDTREADYCVRYATGPGPFGPWEDHGVLLSRVDERDILGTGHHSILRLPGTDEWIIAYHRFAIPGDDGVHREVVFDRLIHRSDGLLEPVDPAPEPITVRIPGQVR